MSVIILVQTGISVYYFSRIIQVSCLRIQSVGERIKRREKAKQQKQKKTSMHITNTSNL